MEVKLQHIEMEKTDRKRPLTTISCKKERNLRSIAFSYKRTPKQIHDYKQTKKGNYKKNRRGRKYR